MMKSIFTTSLKKQQSQPLISVAEIERGYQKQLSIADYLPWCDADDQHKVFLLEDNLSMAVGFEITPLPCEARPALMMEKIAQSFKESIQNAIPQEKNDPWILQVFVTRESSLAFVMDKVKASIDPDRHQEPLVQEHLKTLQTHLEYVSRPQGIFFDQQVTQQIFRGGLWKVYAFIYRKQTTQNRSQSKLEKLQKRREGQWQDIQKISRKLYDQWRACGLGVKRLRPADFHHWMTKWFNPKTHSNQQKNFPTEDHKPITWDFAEQLFFTAPESFEKGWVFDGILHQVITVQGLSVDPVIGHLSAERRRETDDKVFHLLL
jgi:F pilus assembly protein of type IV secretion system